MLCGHCTQNCIFWYFLEAKIVQNLLILVYLLCPKSSPVGFRKTFITQDWLVVKSCPTPCLIAFLMLYWLVHNIRSHFNELNLAWSVYYKDVDAECIMLSKSDNIEFILYDNKNEVVNERFESLLSRYQIGLETSMRGNDFIFLNQINCCIIVYYKCHKIKFNKCFQYVLTVALNHK